MMTHFQLLCVGVTLRFILMVTTTVFVLRNAQFWYVENIGRKTKIRIKKKKKKVFSLKCDSLTGIERYFLCLWC